MTTGRLALAFVATEEKKATHRNVSVSSGPMKYVQKISVGPHLFQGDKVDIGGNDGSPDSYELLMASLGACVHITVQMCAERHHWPLKDMQSTVSYARMHAENPRGSDIKAGMLDRIELEICFAGDLSPEQKERLL